MGVVPKRFVWSPFWQMPIKAPKHFAVVLGWPRFAVGVCLRALRAARPFSVSPPAGGFAGLARRRLGFASARPPFVSRFARRRPPKNARHSRCLALRLRWLHWRPSAWFRWRFAPCRRPSVPSAWSSPLRLLAALAPLRQAPFGSPCRFWRPLLLLRAGPGRLASLGSFPRVGPRALFGLVLRVALSPPSRPPAGGRGALVFGLRVSFWVGRGRQQKVS